MKQGRGSSSGGNTLSGEVDLASERQGPLGVVGSEPQDTLNVLFNWNGHTWDAYEVLGIPAGSSMVAVDKAYNDQIQKMDAESQAFVKMAYQSICQHCKHKSSKSQ